MSKVEQFLTKLWTREEWSEEEIERMASEHLVNLDDDEVIVGLFGDGWRWTPEDRLRRDV